MSWKSKSEKASDRIIIETVAAQLNKDANDVTVEDFAKITTLSLAEKKAYNIQMLNKFENLEELDLNFISLPDPDIPKWMVVLAKMHIIDLYEKYYTSYKNKYYIDLSPLENLSNLQVIHIRSTAVKDLKPLAKIKNLRKLNVDISMLEVHGLMKPGMFLKTVNINGKKFTLQANNNTDNPLPYIHCTLPGYDGTPEECIERFIKSECEDALN